MKKFFQLVVLLAIMAGGWLAGQPDMAGGEILNGDLDKSGAIAAADEVILRNYLAGNLNAIPGWAGQVYQVNPLAGNLRFVPAGTFTQGSPANEPCRGNYPWETRFSVTLARNLAVMETEVTRLMWGYLKVLQPGLPADPSDAAISPAPTAPVNKSSWYETILFANLLSRACGLRPCYYSDAGLNWPIDEDDYTTGPFYCDWDSSGFRLLTEGEWEYACRAGTTTPFWINEPNYTAENCLSNTPGMFPMLEMAEWFSSNSGDTAQPAGWKLANPWGLKDMAGNAMEWCWDLFDEFIDDPPPAGTYRLVRGGGWEYSSYNCRSASRSACEQGWRSAGFRLARTVSASELANPAGHEIWMGDLDRSSYIDAADAVILRNWLAGNLSRIPGQAGQVWRVDPLVGNLRLVPAGTFTQGSPPGEPCRGSNEDQFNHTLTRDLAVMETEVTRLMWSYLKERQTSLPADPSDAAFSPAPTAPVQNLTWNEAVLFANLLSKETDLRACYYSDAALIWPIDEDDYTTATVYCDWNAGGYRLLSEGEWEYACRGGTTAPFWVPEIFYTADNCYTVATAGMFPFLELAAWFGANAGEIAQPAGWKAPNPWGLKDVYGNVFEWCWDWYGVYPTTPVGLPVNDYRGPANGYNRLVRGGSWDSDHASTCRSAYRYWTTFDRYKLFGFRLARWAQ